ncbi:Uncharacterized protein APZ42_029882 [Daphnia magna]|uniref:Uncharacterized protein n=1 Tax=Daphnia magna TaxID=35525 RepID=A0A162D428_9CRUS|nr:Uncharacterized protein APZ42_029882 [Daphnia magna]
MKEVVEMEISGFMGGIRLFLKPSFESSDSYLESVAEPAGSLMTWDFSESCVRIGDAGGFRTEGNAWWVGEQANRRIGVSTCLAFGGSCAGMATKGC